MPGARHVDTHCHLDHPSFDADRQAVLERAASAGVSDIVLPGVEPARFDALLALSRQAAPVRLHVAFGLHPQLLPDVPESSDDELLAGVLAMCSRHRPLGVGECGLDYRVDLERAPRPRQRKVLAFHLALARRLGVPVLLHCLSAHDDMIAEIDAAGGLPAGGVMHSYSGSAEQMVPFLRRGLHISFAGPVSWANARKAPVAAARCPEDRLLVETDAPDQSPEPVRGRRNEPAHVVHVVAAVARARGRPFDEVAGLCHRNAALLFNLS